MGSIAGRIEPQGPFLTVTLMQTSQQVERLKLAKLPKVAPISVRALVDTGASSSAIDVLLPMQLGLIQKDRVLIHTPSGDSEHDLFDVSVFLGSQPGEVKSYTVGAISAELASKGFDALIGWDILGQCALTCDGPSRTFRLDY